MMLKFRPWVCLERVAFALGFTLVAAIPAFAADWILLGNTTINGMPAKLMFDSGSSVAGLSADAVGRLGLRVVIPPTNGLGDTAECTVSLDGSSFKTDFLIFDPGLAPAGFDGLIGWPYLRPSIMRLDSERGDVTPLSEVPPEAKHWQKFAIVTNCPVLQLKVRHDDGTTGIILIDTGYDCGLTLSSRAWGEWRKAHPLSPITLREYNRADGFFFGEESWAEKYEIGPLVLTDIPVMEAADLSEGANRSEITDGVLGMAALKRLDVVIDGFQNVAYLRAKTSPPGALPYNRLGALFVPTEEHTNEAVARVLDGSPAYKAGIRNGDVLLQVDDLHLIVWTNGREALAYFKLPAGTKLHLVLQRNGTNFETTAILRDILYPGGQFPERQVNGDSTAETELNLTNQAENANDADQIARNYYTEGTDELRKGDFNSALADYSNAIEASPDFPEAYFGRACAEQSGGDLESALADYSRAIALKPGFADAYGNRGSAKQAKGDLSGAIADYNKAIALEPESAENYSYRAYLEQLMGNFDSAISDYNNAIKLKPDFAPQLYFRLASIEEAKTNNEAALADYNRAVELKPDYADAYFYRGRIEQSRGDLGGALADYSKVITLVPNRAIVYGYRSEVEASAGDLDRAETDSAEAAKLDPSFTTNTATAFHFLAWSRFERLEYTNALADFRRSCELNPTNDYAQFGAWLCNSLLGNSGRANSDLKAYLATRPVAGSGDWPGKVGDFLTGQITESELLNAADNADGMKNLDQHCEAYFYIGSKRLIAGDKAGAVDYFKKCVSTGAQNFAECRCAKAELQALDNAK